MWNLKPYYIIPNISLVKYKKQNSEYWNKKPFVLWWLFITHQLYQIITTYYYFLSLLQRHERFGELFHIPTLCPYLISSGVCVVCEEFY